MKTRGFLLLMGLFILLTVPLGRLAARENTPFILFVSDPEKNDEVFILDLQTNRIRNLTNKTSRDWHPTWSQDGTRIAFNSDRDGNEEIYVMQANGLDQTDLTNSSSRDLSPDWSPVAEEIAFISDRDGGFDLYILNVTDKTVRRVTTDGQVKSEPDWSPDGTHITYWQQVDKAAILNTVDVATGEIKTLIDSGQNLWPVWSPDGSKIAYYAADANNSTDIFTINIASGAITNLTNDTFKNARPEWSPDGSEIVFMSDRDGNSNLYVMNADGSDPRRLTDTPENDTSPAWQPVFVNINFAANPLLGQGALQIESQNINASAQQKLGNWGSQVLAPNQVNFNDSFRIRVEVIPPGISASTPVPGTSVQDSSSITAYHYMGAELMGHDLQNFELDRDPSRYLLQIRDDEVNYWEWELTPKDRSVIGTQHLQVRLYVPAIPENGIGAEEELKKVYFDVEVIPGETPPESKIYVQSETTSLEGFSLFFSDENSFTIYFANDINIQDMRLATSKFEFGLPDATSIPTTSSKVAASSCLVFVLQGKTPTIPDECAANKTYQQELVGGDIFWYDNGLLDVTVRKDNRADLVCKPDDRRCDF